MIENGTGGANTNLNGLAFERQTDLAHHLANDFNGRYELAEYPIKRENLVKKGALEVEVRGIALSKAVQAIYDECHRKMQHEPKHKPHVVFISTDIEVDETAEAKALLSALVDEGANAERYVLLDDADMFVNDLGRYILAFSCFVRD